MDKLVYVPNPLLRQKADKIKSVGNDEIKIAKKMMQIMLEAPGVGLAANQIGILKQIVTIFFVDQETKKEIGGKYLIAVVKHAIRNGKGITKLGLVRDSVGREGKPHNGSMVN